MEKNLAYVTGISLLGTIISLFFNNWKITVFLLLIYIISSDLFLGLKIAESSINNGLNNIMGNVMDTLNLKNEED